MNFFGGEECVYKDNIPLYVMNYYGKVLDEAFSGDFLKEALLLVDRISPFRGPALYTNGNYTYHCSYDGDYEFLMVKRKYTIIILKYTSVYSMAEVLNN